MCRILRLLSVWAVGVVLSSAGCAREPSNAASGLGGARAEVNLSAKATGVPLVEAAGADARVGESSTGRATPEGAMRALLDGWGKDNPEALWDALPASYQQDINDLVHLAAQR